MDEDVWGWMRICEDGWGCVRMNEDVWGWMRMCEDEWDKMKKMKWDEMKKMRWDEMKKMRWNEMRWDKMRWDELRWDKMRWDEMRWDEIWWDEMSIGGERYNIDYIRKMSTKNLKSKNLWKTSGDLELFKNLPSNLRDYCFFHIILKM